MIGKGSFAKVYLATKNETNVTYAIKAFNKEFIEGQDKGKDSLINEITIMRLLNHPYLLKLYETHETTNSIYFVIDIISGGELLKVIKDKGMISDTGLRKLMKHLLRALEFMHFKNIMHRDLKPENLLLRNKNSITDISDIVVADYGLATKITGNILFKRCGTPGFVAPEILKFVVQFIFLLISRKEAISMTAMSTFSLQA